MALRVPSNLAPDKEPQDAALYKKRITQKRVAQMDPKKSKWSPINNLFGWIAIVAIILMGVLTTLDVIWRWVFGEAVGPVYSLCETLMAVMVWASLAPTQEAGGHINVTIFTEKMKGKTKYVFEIISLLLCLFLFVIIFWKTTEDGLWAFGVKSYRAGDFYRFPTWWARLFVPVGVLAMIGQLVVEIKGSLYLLAREFRGAERVKETDGLEIS